MFELGELRAEVAALKQQLTSSSADAGDEGGDGGARAVSPPKEMVDDMQVRASISSEHRSMSVMHGLCVTRIDPTPGAAY